MSSETYRAIAELSFDGDIILGTAGDRFDNYRQSVVVWFGDWHYVVYQLFIDGMYQMTSGSLQQINLCHNYNEISDVLSKYLSPEMDTFLEELKAKIT